MFREFETENTLDFLEALAVPESRFFVAFFQAAFDGSGTLGQHSAIAYGGAIGTMRQWAAFAEAWSEILRREELRYFKMAEAMTWFGEFQKKHTEWGAERDVRRDRLLRELVALAVTHKFGPVGVFVGAEFSVRERIVEQKEELFKGALLTMLRGVPKGHYAMLICDQEFDLEVRVRAVVASLRKEHGDALAPVSGVCFVDDRVYPAVQLADMIAWLYREYGERINKVEDFQLNPLLAELVQGTRWGLHKLSGPGTLLDDLKSILPD